MPNADAQRFKALIEPHLDALFRAAFRLARNTADAEDLVQETCVRAYVRIGRLRESRPVKAWLLRVLHNVFIDDVRRARAAPTTDVADGTGLAETTAGSDPDPEQSAYGTQCEAQLERAWSRLDRSHRALLALRAEGYTLAEIGEITGLAADVLNARLYRARQSFLRHLTDVRGLAPGARMEIAR